MPGDFCQKQRSPEEKFFNLSGSENLKNKAAKKNFSLDLIVENMGILRPILIALLLLLLKCY